MSTRQIRAVGALVAASIGFVVSLAFGLVAMGLNSPVPWYATGLIVALTASMALGAAVVAPRLIRSFPDVAGSTWRMMGIIYVAMPLLWPAAAALTAAPAAVDGGTIPCLFIGNDPASYCPRGLVGMEAIRALVGEAGGQYVGALALALFPISAAIGLFVFFLLSEAWCFLFGGVVTAVNRRRQGAR